MKIPRGSPALCPTGMHQHRLVLHSYSGEESCIDRSVRRGGNNDSQQIDELLQSDTGQIGSLRMAMKRCIYVGSCVATQFVRGNLESCSGRVVRVLCGVSVGEKCVEFGHGGAAVR